MTCPYDRGYDAFFDGCDESPFQPGTEAYEDWCAGYSEAEIDAGEADPSGGCDYDGQPDEYTEWQDYMGGDDWDHGQFDQEW